MFRLTLYNAINLLIHAMWLFLSFMHMLIVLLANFIILLAISLDLDCQMVKTLSGCGPTLENSVK